jgi:hypothetical protein
MTEHVQVLMRVIRAILYELMPVHPAYAYKQSRSLIKNLKVLSASLVQAALYLTEKMWKLVRCLSWQTWATLLLWFALLGIFVKLEFGSLYLMGTAFALIFYNLDYSKRSDGDMSAWSVFNEGFTTMLGTLSAEQMDREIRHRDMHPANDDEDDD